MCKIKQLKKPLILLFVFLIGASNFAAVVSDNDGSAFVTKAEFDSLKANFKSQINKYNESIDKKIDGAIASYLSGVKLTHTYQATNYIAKMNIVRFYTITKTLNTSELTDIRRRWLVRAFGCASPVSTDHMKRKNTMGSWLYNSDIGHSRDGGYNYTGNSTNYFYQVDYVKLNNVNYPYLKNNYSLSVINTLGAFASYWNAQFTTSDWTDNKFYWRPYNLDLSAMTTNTVEPWSYTWSNFGISATANGYKLNVWNKSTNGSDPVFGYSYFNNNPITTDTDIYTFSQSEFTNFNPTVQTFTCPGFPAHDIWLSVHTTNGNSMATDWSYRRVYTWDNWTTPSYESWFTASNKGEWDNTKATIKYLQPDFKKIKSGNLINGQASSVIGKLVYSYSGVPVTVIEKGTIELELNLTVYTKAISNSVVATGKPYYIVLSNKPFENVSTDSIIAAGENDNIRIFRDTAGTQKKKISIKDIEGTWKKDDIVYMRVKVDDTNYYADVTCSSVIATQ